jgi:hypothetical protein
LENADYYIYISHLPSGIKAMIIPNDDSTFSMYLDPQRTREQWMDDWEHEIWHLIHDDFYNNKPIWVVEAA